jgi:P-type Ca2+ transporter type 2C
VRGDPDLTALLAAGALCNDAALRPPDDDNGAWTAVGDPTEAALLTAAGKLGLDIAALSRELPRVAEIPFDSDRKRMVTVHRLLDGGTGVICKGAPEVMLRLGVIAADADTLVQAKVRAGQLSREGFRVLAIAAAQHAGQPPLDEVERDLALLGLVAIFDPPRPAARATIAACRAAGITPVLITGDHAGTAAAIARDLGILDGDGGVVDCATPDGLGTADAGTRVFARATPEQKLSIIEAIRAGGDVVAMTGDGVNDGPALRAADIGVAMGERGTEVALADAGLLHAGRHSARGGPGLSRPPRHPGQPQPARQRGRRPGPAVRRGLPAIPR